MSLLARIFIVFNAVLAVLFLGIVSTTYSHRTDWRMASLHTMGQFSHMVQRKDRAIQTLKSDVQSMNSLVQVQIGAEDAVVYQEIITAMDLAKEAGFPDISILDPPSMTVRFRE